MTIQRIRSLPTRLIEKRMEAAAKRFYQQSTEAENDAERIAFFSTFDSIQILVEEARQLPVYQQIRASAQSPDSAIRLAAAQTTSLDDCVTMYVLVRLKQPLVMVETGVFYGAMSAMILHAMQRNGSGRLISIDLPNEADGLDPKLRGALVPDRLQANWRLILGDSRVALPRILSELGTVDAFNHDSLHSTRHMTWEFETAWSKVPPGGFLSSHDVLTTPSWERFGREHQSQLAGFGRVYGLGIAYKRA